MRAVARAVRARCARLGARLKADWRGAKYVTYGGALVLLTTLVTTAYYVNRPLVERDPDTPAYVAAAHHILASGTLVDPARLPGYPLLIAAVFALARREDLNAVTVAQAALFILATLELYVVLCLVLRRSWVAFAITALVGVNTHLLSYVKPILSEGLALFLLTTLALAVTLAIRVPRLRTLWLVAACTLALVLTRPEWIYLPVPLFAYLLLVAYRRNMLRRLGPHALGAVLMLYGVLGLYIHVNSVQNNCAGVTSVQNYNLLGKVMQYHMQDEAPPQFAGMTVLVDSFVVRGDEDPWDVVRSGYPPLQANCHALAGTYSMAIITRHPLEYLARSIPVAGETLSATTPFLPLAPSGPDAGWLRPLNAVSEAIVRSFLFFPLAALCCLGALFWRSRQHTFVVEAMGALALLAAYGVVLTSLGAYVYYPRLHSPYAPLLTAVVWGTLALGGMLGGMHVAKRVGWQTPTPTQAVNAEMSSAPSNAPHISAG